MLEFGDLDRKWSFIASFTPRKYRFTHLPFQTSLQILGLDMGCLKGLEFYTSKTERSEGNTLDVFGLNVPTNRDWHVQNIVREKTVI